MICPDLPPGGKQWIGSQTDGRRFFLSGGRSNTTTRCHARDGLRGPEGRRANNQESEQGIPWRTGPAARSIRIGERGVKTKSKKLRFSSVFEIPVKSGDASRNKADQDQKNSEADKIHIGNLPEESPAEGLDADDENEQPSHGEPRDCAAD